MIAVECGLMQIRLTSILGRDNLKETGNSLQTSEKMLDLNLPKLFIDLHTGKVLFGENPMWAWINLIGLSILVIATMGIWI